MFPPPPLLRRAAARCFSNSARIAAVKPLQRLFAREPLPLSLAGNALKSQSGAQSGLLSRFTSRFAPNTTPTATAGLFARRSASTVAQADAGASSADGIYNQPLTKPGWETEIGSWLFGIAGMCFGMIVIGGYTRLSGSGLSMTSWKFTGRFLPVGKDEWERQFGIYKETPEYKKLHRGTMDLDEFKMIYFTEWFHRMWGRCKQV